MRYRFSPSHRHLAALPRNAVRLLILVLVASSMVLAACGAGDATPTVAVQSETEGAATATGTASTGTTPQATTEARATPVPATATPMESPGGSATTTLRVYFLRDEKITTASRIVPKTQQVGAAALEELLKGPVDAEKASGFSSAIPAGTQVLGLNIDDSVATVNLSKEFESGGGSFSMRARLAQVVYTLTQFPTVTTVQFQIDGQPVTTFGGEGVILEHPVGRADFEDLTPLILVESPTLGAAAGNPVRITGTANTFEATFQVEVVGSDGAVLAEEVVTATSGSGMRGTFDVTVPYTVNGTSQGSIVVYAASPKDGSRMGEVTIPVQLQP